MFKMKIGVWSPSSWASLFTSLCSWVIRSRGIVRRTLIRVLIRRGLLDLGKQG